MDLPDGWEPISYLCYPRTGSKAYRRDDGANAHLIDLYGTGHYVVQLETADGDFFEARIRGYERAVGRLKASVAAHERGDPVPLPQVRG